MLRVGRLTIDLAARIVEIEENRLELPAKEYELLRTLAREPTRVLTKVNFEPRPEEGKGSEGLRGSGRDW
jgi:DNA-binding response OmpR family regulator